MERKRAMVDPQKCNPWGCSEGICLAKLQCPRKIIKQEGSYEIPFIYGNGDLCRGCFICEQACPCGAISRI